MKVIPHYREGRTSPWEARWYVHRKLKSRFFATEKERDDFIRSFNREVKKHGTDVLTYDKDLMKQWHEASLLLPGVRPIELVEHWLDTHPDTEDKVLSEGFAAYCNNLELAGRDPAYRSHVARTYDRFTAFCGNCLLHEVKSEQISAFIHDSPFNPVTKRHIRTDLAGAFRWFVKKHWVIHNPVDAVPAPKVEFEEPGILTVEETEALFRANEKEDPEICALLALGAFAGMRSSAIARMDYKEIDFAARAILTPASKTKKNRRQFIEGLPDNLFEWLSLASKKTFAITPRQFQKRREKAFERAGLLISKAQAKRDKTTPKAPPKNCLRHSFVSYHVVLHRNPGHTALLISHKNQNILYEHYLGVATKEDAEQYFGIKPA